MHAVRAMFASLGLPVCDDAVAIAEARDAQRDTMNRKLNSTKGSVAVAAQAWFEAVDGLLNQRPKLLEGLFNEFSALADAMLVMAGAAGRKRLAGRVRAELQALAQRWLGAREDLAEIWVERWLAERGRSLPASDGGNDNAQHPERRKRLILAMVGALAVVATLGGLYHSVGLGDGTQTAAAATQLAQDPGAHAQSDEPTPDQNANTQTLTAGTGQAADVLGAVADPAEPLVTTVQSPGVAFGGHRLVIAIQTQTPVLDELIDAEFAGATLHDVRRAPGGVAVELSVAKPLDDSESEASWSFRLLDASGQRSELISGSCEVLQGGW
ncbi:MAG: hypothetical protein DRQ55_05175 [Planctomycetota bacterium]|nr:MAG: hypothetical protein DRQ55_05175 [Planctomycetota bacterium]